MERSRSTSRSTERKSRRPRAGPRGPQWTTTSPPALEPAGATIVATATGPAPGGVGILRLSGPLALELGLGVVRGVAPRPRPRHAYFARFVDREAATLDQGLFLFFQAPHSFTGEDV